MQNQSYNTINSLVQLILSQNYYMIGVAGIPGAGKSYISKQLSQQLPNSKIIPFDGFHKYRSQLTSEQMVKRGAIFTFNLQNFTSKMQLLQKKKFPIMMPSFDHSEKDPKQNTIVIDSTVEHVIVEGLYIFDQQFIKNIHYDLKIWIDCHFQECIQRLINRHFESKIENTIEDCQKRVYTNEKINAAYVQENSDRKNCLYIQNK